MTDVNAERDVAGVKTYDEGFVPPLKIVLGELSAVEMFTADGQPKKWVIFQQNARPSPEGSVNVTVETDDRQRVVEAMNLTARQHGLPQPAPEFLFSQ